MTRILTLGTAVLAAVVSSGCVVSVDSQGQVVTDEKRFTLDGRPDLHLATFDGSIEIRSWERTDVLVEIEKRGPTQEAVDNLKVESSQKGSRIDLAITRPSTDTFSGLGFHRSTSARLIVSVPLEADVVARTGDGAIRVDRVRGRLELRTGDGSIRASDVEGELVLHTGDGSVTVDRGAGRLELETGDGGVDVTGKFASVRMHTGDGSIVYRADPGGTMAGDWDISTGDGSVALYLPRDFAAEFDARTGDGRIKSDLAVAADGTPDDRNRTLTGRIGEGGRRLRVRTGDGSITLKTR
jgi:DUF4097 and DUF4098 domain-containing protein YvlB